MAGKGTDQEKETGHQDPEVEQEPVQELSTEQLERMSGGTDWRGRGKGRLPGS